MVGWTGLPRLRIGCESVATTRRDFLRRAGMGFGWLAFAGLANRAAALDRRLEATHFAARAKHVIFLFMDGGVSHVDSFDPKPELAKHHGQPAKWRTDVLSQGVSANRKWLKNPWDFRQRGESGLWVSDLKQRSLLDETLVV